MNLQKRFKRYKKVERALMMLAWRFDDTIGFDEAFAHANLVFIECAHLYDRSMGTKFITFIYSKVNGSLLNLRKRLLKESNARRKNFEKRKVGKTFDVERMGLNLSEKAKKILSVILRPNKNEQRLINLEMEKPKRRRKVFEVLATNLHYEEREKRKVFNELRTALLLEKARVEKAPDVPCIV